MEQYIERINQLSNPSFRQILEIARNNCGITCPGKHLCKPWKTLNHGVDLLNTHDQLCKYLCAYGEMHEEKMQITFNTIKEPDSIFDKNFTIIDWGCGQGLASLCFFDYLKQRNLPNNTQKVILIEPSFSALSRAKQHINAYLKDETKIELKNKFIDEIIAEDLQTKTSIVLHFFSNILDIPSIDLKRLAHNIGFESNKEQYLFCIAPLNYGNRRLEAFYNYFDKPKRIVNDEINRLPITKKTLKLLVFKLDAGKISLIKIKYYPPVQFHAAYQLDCVKQSMKSLPLEVKNRYKLMSSFEVYAPFDIGASIYDDVHPILAVLNNIVVRGLPTRTSPYIESLFEKFGNQKLEDDLGEIKFANNKLQTIKLLSSLECLTPIAIARVQKTILEALITNILSIYDEKWLVLVTERDVPCAAIAFEDLKQMFNHITKLSKEYSLMKFPDLVLEIISTPEFADSPLHLNNKVLLEPHIQQKTTEYDMVIDVSLLMQPNSKEIEFSEFHCKNNCYFNIRSAVSKRNHRYIYTSHSIEYKDVVVKDSQGVYAEISDTKEHLQYFLQLLFRKNDFRSGQLPILDRALQNKSVIGLLPTGGGKSLTYQLAAMLQPGVTIVIDPLRSLMKDQYDSLINSGIDTCTYINSTHNALEKEFREKQMESSQMQFVFMSPERLCIYKFRERLKTMRDMNVYFAYGVIDEVHCVSEWGHDFRFSYLHLGRNLFNYVCPKNKEKHLTLFGLTATASFDVLADVERELSGNGSFPLDSDTIVRYENTNRLELQYKVEKINTDIEPWVNDPKWEVYKSKNKSISKVISKIPDLIEDLQSAKSIEFIKNKFIDRENLDSKINKIEINNINKAVLSTKLPYDWLIKPNYESGGIVFCPHRQGSLGVDSTKNTGVADAIKTSLGCPVGTFKGGDQMSDQDRFIKNEVPIMVATKAFGMGIDKPNVRFTVNINMSSSLEGFVQEAGRAGRDRRMALATILYSDYIDIDKDVQMFFFDNNFKGKDFEKKIMNRLLSHSSTDVFIGDDAEHKDDLETIDNFLDKYITAEPNIELVAFVKYPQQKNDLSKFDFVFWNKKEVKLIMEKDNTAIIEIDGIKKQVSKSELIYKSDISKAIFRMTSIELIEDFTEDYSNSMYRIVSKVKKEGDFYLALRRFLTRYFSVDRANEEIRIVKNIILPKPTTSILQKELYQCLNYLTEFIYEKIAIKRKRAIEDMNTFCMIGVDNTKDWKEINEELKDFIFYYFNSKYARSEYETLDGEGYSLTNDTDEGKESNFDILLKYLRIVDSDFINNKSEPGSTQIDNVKHLQGAVRLLRRSLTDSNPTLSLLNAFCICFLGTNSNEKLEKELIDSYNEGMLDFAKRAEKDNKMSEFWNVFDKYNELISTFGVDKRIINAIKNNSILSVHAFQLKTITNKYIK